MIHFFKKIIIATALLLQGCLVVSAASITTTSQSMQVHAGDVFIADVVMNTEGSLINTIDGSIKISTQGQFQVRDISVAGSDIVLWPRKPSLSTDGSTVSFVGGIPGGINDTSVRLFKIILFVEKEGTVQFLPNVTGYLNDGKGTVKQVTATASSVTLLASRTTPINEWANTFKKDVVQPEPFKIVMYQDDQLYDGKKFITFGTTDRDSGVNYYEVREGGRLPVRSGDQYVLINQGSYQKVTVSAHDYAGNIRTITSSVGKRPVNWLVVVIGVIVVSIIIKRKALWAVLHYYVFKKRSQH